MNLQENMVFSINPAANPKDFKLKSIEWAIITQIDGKKTIKDISQTLSLTTEEIQVYFTRLSEFNLISKLENNEVIEYVDSSVIDDIEKELVVLVGPVAAIILDDILLDMNKTRDNLEKSKVGTFVELIKNEIDDSEKKMKFLEIVLPQINNL